MTTQSHPDAQAIAGPPLVTEIWNLTKSLPLRARHELADYAITAADSCDVPPSEFYKAVRDALESQKLPGLQAIEVLHTESGFGSAQRVYLRLARERIHFDICAAPFGTAFFFSYRAVVKLPLPHWLLIFLLSLGALAMAGLLTYLANLIFVLRVAIWVGPIISTALFVLGLVRIHQTRAETFYRLDTRAMFLSLVKQAYEAAVANLAKDRGVRLRWRVTDPSMLKHSIPAGS